MIYLISMKKNRFILLIFIFTLLTSCQTIKQKSDEIAEKENERFGQFIGKQVNELKLELGVPNDDYINELGNETLIYKTKKYGIPCERKFEIDENSIVIGFVSNGCF